MGLSGDDLERKFLILVIYNAQIIGSGFAVVEVNQDADNFIITSFDSGWFFELYCPATALSCRGYRDNEYR
jgi:hypothetical protein